MKILTFLFLLLLSFFLNAQDVIYTVSGDYNGGKTPIDSIIIDNITNGTSMSFGELPEHDYYQINLTKGAFWGTVSVFDIEETSIFQVIQNEPGLLSVRYRGTGETDAKVSVINVNGQKIYMNDDLYLHPQNTLQVKLGSEGVYFVKVESPVKTSTFKAIGNDENISYEVKLSDDINTKFASSPKLKSTSIIGEGDFIFEDGDSIRIWAFRKDVHAWPKNMRIKDSDKINFQFEDIHYIEEAEKAYPDSVGEIIPFLINDETYYCEKINGEYIFHGDIVLTEEQVNGNSTKGAWVPGSVLNPDTYLWPDGKVYYEISNEFENIEGIVEAIDYWNNVSSVKFIPRDNHMNYVEFKVNVDGGYKSNIGFIPIYWNKIWVPSEYQEPGSVVHEMGHTIGLIHEHQRSDRDEFVTIFRDRISDDDYKKNYKKYKSSFNVGAFDYQSLMLYGTNNKQTILNIDYSELSTQRSSLSVWDIKTIDEMYDTQDSKKPWVNVGLDINYEDLSATITGTIVNNLDGVSHGTIAWKKNGDTAYNIEDIGIDSYKFQYKISNIQCGEYLFYATATNDFGKGYSLAGSQDVAPFTSLMVESSNSNSVRLSSEISLNDCMAFLTYAIDEKSEKCIAGISNWMVEIKGATEHIDTIISGLEPKKTYYVRAETGYHPFVNKEVSTNVAIGDVIEFTTPEVETSSFTDSRDKKTYKTVKIGDQWWMAQNLAFKPSSGSWAYNNDQANVEKYGRLYTAFAALNACPSDWHLPNDQEWLELEKSIGLSEEESLKGGWRGTDEGTKLKAVESWPNGTDVYEFEALPGGYRGASGSYYGLESSGYWWSSNVNCATVARYLYSNISKINRNAFDLESGFSVRCVKNRN